jgi:hypothetical protein
MSSHKFTVKLTFEVEKEGLMSNPDAARENVRNFIPKVIKELYTGENGFRITVVEDDIEEVLDTEE